ncbi:hypothetical protein FA15DRAFT_758235 [Coprinopsis marcescibilis]|uniref:F-box domain-containing protein n=1 Tax=Coprinopsis marcescibilis TaxID=230819 RepID=A0A5C3KPP2_COPMA|nr:hypothetical protein FA15DRAFT_758235 [Coprinopsis marcescibilis]
MSELPPELWALIARHLPSDTVIGLMGLNRCFRKLALDELYRTLTVTPISRSLQKCLARLGKQDHLAQRVRSVVIHPLEADTDHRPSKMNPSLRIMNRLILVPPAQLYDRITGKSIAPRLEASVARISAIGLLNKVLPRLKNITNLTIIRNNLTIKADCKCLGCEFGYYPISNIPWALYAPNLQCLNLVILAGDGELFQLPRDITFPNLIELALQVKFSSHAADSQFSQTIAYFVHHVCTTLKAFKLSVDGHSSNWVDTIFDTLPTFPLLQSLEVSSCTSSIPFIRRYSQTLQNLAYNAGCHDTADLLSDINFTSLQSLSINLMCNHSSWWSKASPMLVSTLATLRTLQLHTFASHDRLEAFLTAVAKIGECDGEQNSVEDVRLSAYDISWNTLPLIAQAFPSLRSLTLIISSLDVHCSSEKYETISYTLEEFHSRSPELILKTREMFADLPQPWGLEHVVIEHQVCSTQLVRIWGLMSLLSECVESIRNVNFYGNGDIPSHDE